MTIKIDSVCNTGIIKYEITSKDLITAMESVVEKIANSVVVKLEEARTPEYISGEKPWSI